MNNYKIGDFGHAIFIAKKGWKYPTDCHGRITDMDSKCVAFTDNDDNEYIIERKNFRFEPEVFKVKT